MHGIEQEGLWYDEMSSCRYLSLPALIDCVLSVQRENPVATPFFYALEHVWARLVDGSVISERILSVLLGEAGILGVYLFTARLYSPRAGLLAALFLALNGFHRYYSMELRPYVLVFTLGAFSAHAFLLAVETGRKRHWVVNLLCNYLMIWSHVFSVFALIPQGLILLLRLPLLPRRALLWGVLNGMFLVSGLLWIRLLDPGLIDAAASWIPRPTLLGVDTQSVLGLYAACAGRQKVSHEPAVSCIAGYVFWGMLALLLAAGAAACLGSRRARGESRGLTARERMVFLLAWLLAPPTALFLLSYLWMPCFVNRYLITCLIPFWALVAGGISAVPRHWARASIVACLCLLICIQAAPVLRCPQRPDWQIPARLIQQTARRDTPIVAASFGDSYCLRYFLGPRFNVIQANSVREMADRVAGLGPDHPEVLALLRDNWTDEDRPRFERELNARNLHFQSTPIPGARTMYLYRFFEGTMTPGARRLAVRTVRGSVD